jgi:CubicO group peptidase (beta-lactamase class C family)
MAMGAALALLTWGLAASPFDASSASAADAKADAIEIGSIVQNLMQSNSLRAVIVKVTRGRTVITRAAVGNSLDGVMATPEMTFRNGAVVFAYIGNLLMQYVDQGKVSLDDTIERWEPRLPQADKVTLEMLANQTSGYPDFETDEGWTTAFNTNPFQSWTYENRLQYAFARPMQFEPGTNWSYSHTNFMILGDILAKIGKKPLDVLLRNRVLKPMGLAHTTASKTGAMPEPVLHSFSSERRATLGIPPSGSFYEESTFWNANWGTPVGASQATTIDDMAKTAVAVGTGKLLTKKSFHAMTDSKLIGFGEKQENCVPSCFTQQVAYNYGLGIVRSGSWILQNPQVGGYSATEAYLPSEKISISVVTTFAPGAFDCEGVYPNSSDVIFRAIGQSIAPNDAPPPGPTISKAC